MATGVAVAIGGVDGNIYVLCCHWRVDGNIVLRVFEHTVRLLGACFVATTRLATHGDVSA